MCDIREFSNRGKAEVQPARSTCRCPFWRGVHLRKVVRIKRELSVPYIKNNGAGECSDRRITNVNAKNSILITCKIAPYQEFEISLNSSSNNTIYKENKLSALKESSFITISKFDEYVLVCAIEKRKLIL